MRAGVIVLLIGLVCAGVPGQAEAQEGAAAPIIFKYAQYVLEAAVVAVHSHDLLTWINERVFGRKHPLTADEENALGVKFLTGDKVPVDKQEARTHFERASRAGNLHARVNIAVMYMHGDMATIEGREVGGHDWLIAGEMLRRVIDQTRNRVAEYNLGVGAEHFGYLDDAIYWYNEAKGQGYRDAFEAVSQLCRNATFSLGQLRYYRAYPTGPIISRDSWERYC